MLRDVPVEVKAKELVSDSERMREMEGRDTEKLLEAVHKLTVSGRQLEDTIIQLRQENVALRRRVDKL